MELTDDEITNIIGRNVYERRRLAGLSQQAVGEALGVTFQQVQKYERGFNRISPASLFRLAALFNCQLLDFFAGIDTPAPIAGDDPNRIPEHRLVKAYRAIEDQKVKKTALALVEALGRSDA